MIPPVLVLAAYLGAARRVARETAADLVASLTCAAIGAIFRVETQLLDVSGRVSAWAYPEEPPTGPDPWDTAPAPARAPEPILPELYRAELYRAAAGDVRDFARGEGRASAARASLRACARRDPDTAEALLVYVERLDHYAPARLEAVAANLDRCAELAEAPAPAAVASRATPVRIAPEARRPAPTELHYVRDYERTLCGGPVHGASRATGSATVWADEPEASRCGDCAAQMGGAP